MQTANTINWFLKIPYELDSVISSYDNAVLNTIALPKGSPDGIDYYGIQTILQMSSLLCLISIYTVLNDKTKNIYPRIMTIPVSKAKVISARAMADVLFVWVVLIILAVLSNVILGTNWSGNYFIIFDYTLVICDYCSSAGDDYSKDYEVSYRSIRVIHGIWYCDLAQAIRCVFSISE